MSEPKPERITEADVAEAERSDPPDFDEGACFGVLLEDYQRLAADWRRLRGLIERLGGWSKLSAEYDREAEGGVDTPKIRDIVARMRSISDEFATEAEAIRKEREGR